MADKQKPAHNKQAPSSEQQLARLMLDEGLVGESQMKSALRAQKDSGAPLLTCLLDSKAIDSGDLYSFLSAHSGAPSIDVRNYEIPRELVDLIPKEFAREHSVMPIDKMGKLLTVGMANPMDTEVIEELERLTGLRVKPMLCKSDDIGAKIQRYYPRDVHYDDLLPEVQIRVPAAKPRPASKPSAPAAPQTPRPEALTRPEPPRTPRVELAETLERVQVLTPAPGTVEKIVAAAGEGAAAVKAMAAIAGADPAVTAALLRMANSPAYGMPGRVGNVNVAMVLMGAQGAKEAMKLFDGVTPVQDFDYGTFWTRSMFCATAAAAMAIEKCSELAADAYAAGMLHDMGRLALAMAAPEADVELSGVHEEAGYLLAKQWRLPQTLALPIRFHHAPNRGAEGELVAEVALAAVMAEAYLRGETLTAASLEEHRGLLQEVGLDAAQAAKVYAKVGAAVKGKKK